MTGTGWRSDRRGRLPGNWPRLRARVLRRDPVCRACGLAPSAEVDHVQPGDNHDETNLQGLCRPCHARKSAREGIAARKSAGAYRRRARDPEPHPGVINP